MISKEECIHVIEVLKQTKKYLREKNALKLKELSNQTIHGATCQQDSASITIAVILYALSKLIEREDYDKIKNWEIFVKKFNALFDLAISSLEKENFAQYEKNIKDARETLGLVAASLKPYIQDVIKKASINKGSKIYEHGVSLEQTAKLLGITQWELSDYIGQRNLVDKKAETFEIKKRAKMAMEFFEV